MIRYKDVEFDKYEDFWKFFNAMNMVIVTSPPLQYETSPIFDSFSTSDSTGEKAVE